MIAPMFAQYGDPNGEWRYYAGDNGSSKYSPLLSAAIVDTPMTYMVDGTQYIAATVQTAPPSLIALALP